MLLSPENKDNEFLDKFNRVIKDLDLDEADDDGNKPPSEYDMEDSYLDIELGIRRDD